METRAIKREHSEEGALERGIAGCMLEFRDGKKQEGVSSWEGKTKRGRVKRTLRILGKDIDVYLFVCFVFFVFCWFDLVLAF